MPQPPTTEHHSRPAWRLLGAVVLGLSACAAPPVAKAPAAAMARPAVVPVTAPDQAVMAPTLRPESAASVNVDAAVAPPTEPVQPAPLAGEEIDRGLASWYGQRFHGRRTASGERFDMNALTAAHRTLPFGTQVRVRSVRTGQEVTVRINDRGPHLRQRVIDLSHAAATALGIRQHGLSEVVLARD